MNQPAPTTLEELRDRMEEAKQALLADPGIPCRGQLYAYQRGARRYYKWQRCEGGRRTQRTVDLAGMEVVAEGLAVRAQFEQRLQNYYAAAEAYALACVQHGERPACGTPVKKPSVPAKKKSGMRRSVPARRS